MEWRFINLCYAFVCFPFKCPQVVQVKLCVTLLLLLKFVSFICVYVVEN